MPSSPLTDIYRRTPLRLVRGEGAFLIAEDGTRYLDLTSGIGVNHLGHAHPRLVKALQVQSEQLWHISNLFEIPGQKRFARRLNDSCFSDSVIFVNSGAESVETMLKVARRYQYGEGRPGRWRVITFEGSFHGRTLAALSAAGNPDYLEGFGPRVDGFDTVPFGDSEAVRNAVRDETAAIMIEPIQGEGGVRVCSDAFLKALRQIADENNLLLLFDEVQCGAGRTGRMWAHQWSGVEPDIMAAAKGLGGGLPIGTVLSKAKVAKHMTPGSHGSTLAGNPLAVAVGNVVLDMILDDPAMLPAVEKKGAVLKKTVEEIALRHQRLFFETTGRGLMIGLSCSPAVSHLDVIAALRERRVLTVASGRNSIRILPPFTIEDEHIALLRAALEDAAQSLEAKLD